MTSAHRQAGTPATRQAATSPTGRAESTAARPVQALRPAPGRGLGGTVVRAGLWLAFVGLVVALPVLPRAAAAPQPPDGPGPGVPAAQGTPSNGLAAAQARLDEALARVEAAQDRVRSAVEAFNAARIELQERRRNAELTEQTAERAREALEEALAQVGRLAADVYREGQDLGGLEVLLGPGGLQRADAHRAAITAVGLERRRAVQRMDATRATATALQEQARIELERAETATRALGVARARAERSVTGTRTELASATAQREQALRQIAEMRRTTLQVERARQTRVQAQAERRAAEQLGAGGNATAGSGSSSGEDPGGGRTENPSTVPRGSGHGNGGGSASTAGERAVAWARQQVGLPYRWGGAGPDSYDCSGLTMRAWQRAGVSLPHFAASQYDRSGKVSYPSLRPGDLIFYASNTSDPDTITHVTMYVGGGMMIEAPYTGARVRIVPVRYRRAMPSAGRPS
jgi:peptidoglycan DL-endopeptidase CwlO